MSLAIIIVSALGLVLVIVAHILVQMRFNSTNIRNRSHRANNKLSHEAYEAAKPEIAKIKNAIKNAAGEGKTDVKVKILRIHIDAVKKHLRSLDFHYDVNIQLPLRVNT